MPQISDPKPQFVKDELNQLNVALNSITAKTPDNLLIATWNIKAFGNLTEKWEAEPEDSPSRDLHSLWCIIEILKRFDIIAIQEVKDNIKCLRHTMRMLGSDWSFIMTDVTRGDAGNNERLAFIFNTTRVKLSGLACEIVVPDEQLKNNIGPDALTRQFARTPYAVSFVANKKTFVLLTLHVLYGDNSSDRVPELKAIANWMYDWAEELNRWNHSLIILGDFNIAYEKDEAYKAFMSKNLYIPEEIRKLPSTIFKARKLYDQIGWFKDNEDISKLNLEYLTGNIFDFREHMLKSRNYTMQKLQHRISDHFPLWVAFKV